MTDTTRRIKNSRNNVILTDAKMEEGITTGDTKKVATTTDPEVIEERNEEVIVISKEKEVTTIGTEKAEIIGVVINAPDKEMVSNAIGNQVADPTSIGINLDKKSSTKPQSTQTQTTESITATTRDSLPKLSARKRDHSSSKSTFSRAPKNWQSRQHKHPRMV